MNVLFLKDMKHMFSSHALAPCLFVLQCFVLQLFDAWYCMDAWSACGCCLLAYKLGQVCKAGHYAGITCGAAP